MEQAMHMTARAAAFVEALRLEEVDWDLLSSYAGLLGLATCSIYAGANGSLPRKRLAKGTGTEKVKKTEDEDEDDEDEESDERMSSEDAWIFPIVSLLCSWW
ncbi:hypothetical protein CVT25_005862 [Psilocybe cyanescens]|uniref:Uncharacterized protein n=1 Tax=Psilocybe cyanescens TaxID=93625 RepID=A0A409VM10_PSICY|nr:hypothetical protein CVT25_005862 [Psilocybe cyanescens]